MLVDDADRQARWYFELKAAHLESQRTGEPMRHPVAGPSRFAGAPDFGRPADLFARARASKDKCKNEERSFIPRSGIQDDGRAALSQRPKVEICFHVLPVGSDHFDGGVVGFNFRGVVFQINFGPSSEEPNPSR